MNERIFKLWNQANSRYTNDYALSGKPREEWRSIPDLFAELVEAAARADQREKCAKLVVNLFDPADSVAEFIAEKILATGVEA